MYQVWLLGWNHQDGSTFLVHSSFLGFLVGPKRREVSIVRRFGPSVVVSGIRSLRVHRCPGETIRLRSGIYSLTRNYSCASTISSGNRRFTYAGKPTFLVRDADPQMRSKHLSMPVQARVKHNFKAASSSEFLSPSFSLGMGTGSTETLPTPPSQSVSEHSTHISWKSMPAVPEPALASDRRFFDASQLV